MTYSPVAKLSRRSLAALLLASPAAFGQADARRTTRSARLRTALCAYSFRKALQSKAMTYEDLIRMAADLGVDGVDMTVYWFPSTGPEFLVPLRGLAYRNGVEIYSISVRTDLCKPPGPGRDAQAAELRKWIEVADRLGAGHIRVFGGNVPKGSTEEQAAGWVTEMLKAGTEAAGPWGITLGLENHGGITAKAERIVQIVEAVKSPWLGINLDTGNFDRDGYRQFAQCLPHAVNVQVKTEIRDEQGKNQPADWPRLVGMLRTAGYRGYLALEYEAAEDAAQAVPRLTRELSRVVAG